jgi:hypothetical protein
LPIRASVYRPDRSPRRRGLRGFGIARRKKNLQLMGRQRFRCRRRRMRPPSKSSAGKPFVAKPKSLAVVHQYFQRGGRPIAKHENPTAKRIVLQHVLAQSGQAVDPATKIGRLNRRHDPHLRRDLNHGRGFQKLRLIAAKSGTATPFSWIRILAPPFSSSKRHSQEPADVNGTSSTKDGELSASRRPAAVVIALDRRRFLRAS